MEKWQETVGQGFGTGRKKGTSKTKQVVNQDDGSLAGHEVEHWDDRQDANIIVNPVGARSRTQDGRE